MEKTERIDDLQYNGLRLIQCPSDFCFGCDSVEIANFVPPRRGEKICDLGAGNGIISVLLAAKKNYNVTAVEIQENAAKLCERNAHLNGLEDKIEVLNIAMQRLPEYYPKGSFDAVVTNPPYSKSGAGESAEEKSRAIARHEIAVTLQEVIAAAAYLLKFGGKFYMVYPSARLAEVIAECEKASLVPKVLQILTPDDKKPPHLFLLQCTFMGNSGIKVLPQRKVNIANA